MDGEMDRIEFSDGTWWEIYKEMPYGVRRKARRLMAPFLKADVANQEMVVDEANFDAAVLDDLQMVKLVGCTGGWSWDKEVSEETVEQKPTSKVETVLARMGVLYDADDEVETTKGAKKRTSNRSTQK